MSQQDPEKSPAGSEIPPRNSGYHVLNMCDFCSYEFPACAAQPVWVKEIQSLPPGLENYNSVVACDKYKSPVDVLNKRFH